MPHMKQKCSVCKAMIESRGMKSHLATHRTQTLQKQKGPKHDEHSQFREGYRAGFQDALATLRPQN